MGINPTPTEDVCNALVVSELILLFYVVCVINLPIATVIHCRGGVYPHPNPANEIKNHIQTLIAFTRCRGGLHALPQKMSQPI